MTVSKLGRPSVFLNKNGRYVNGTLTKTGTELFDAAHRQLIKLTGKPKVSQADVIEFLARGEENTLKYLEGKVS